MTDDEILSIRENSDFSFWFQLQAKKHDVVSLLKNYEKVFDTMIRRNVTLTEASAMNQDIFSYNDQCAGAVDYMNLSNEISKIK